MSLVRSSSTSDTTDQEWELPWDHILSFIVNGSPMTALSCMMVNKSMRKAAGHLLNKFDSDMRFCCHTTLAQRELFNNFLKNPRDSLRPVTTEHRNTAMGLQNMGPIREWAIQDHAEEISKSILIIKAHKEHEFDYGIVAIVHPETGHLQATYNMGRQTCLRPHNACGRRQGEYCYGDDCTLQQSGSFWHAQQDDETTSISSLWVTQIRRHFLCCDSLAPVVGDVLKDSFVLLRMFQGKLSPAETMVVLLHALLSDTRTISGCLTRMSTRKESATNPAAFTEWVAEMKALEYPMTRPSPNAKRARGKEEVEDAPAKKRTTS